jgi:hypothetical protein
VLIRKLRILLAFLLALGIAPHAGAATIGLSDPGPAVSVGQKFLPVQLTVTGLGIGEAVSAFSLFVIYDPALIQLAPPSPGVEPGPDFSLLFLVDSTTTPGSIELFASSLLGDTELVTNQQSGSVVLATLQFEAIAPGSSSLGLSQVLLGGVGGPTVPALQVDVAQAPILSAVDAVAVPEPGTLMLIAAGLLLLASRRARFFA